MKQVKLYLVLVLIAFVAFGCSKTPTETPPPANTTPTKETQVAQAADDLAFSCEGNIGTWDGYLTGSSWKKSGKDVVDTMWWGPDAQSWYRAYLGNAGWIYSPSGDTTAYLYRWSLRFFPDVWATVAADKPDSLEWRWDYKDTSASSSWYMKLGYDYDTLHVKGLWEWRLASGTYNFAYIFTFDSVSVSESDYQGNYTFSCNYWPYLTANGYAVGTLTGNYHFNVDRTGTGSVLLDGTELVRYVFYDLANTYDGYYTLASESWATNHYFPSSTK
ncbi:MAG: hypothetical protein Q8O74_08120 [bacterium]|nr:hypothetical protein [bacterium]